MTGSDISLSIDIKGVKSDRYGNDLLGEISTNVEGPGILWVQGSNGTGKSTLTSILSGKSFLGERLNINGAVRLQTPDGQSYTPTRGFDLPAYARRVAYLPPRVGASLLAVHHQDDICLGIEGRFSDLRGTTKHEKDQDAVAWLQPLLAALDAWKHLPRRTGQSSYGEIRRIEFASTAASQASLVILDEPFSGLDPHWRQIFASAVSRLSGSYPSIWIITAHETPEALGLNLKPTRAVTLKPHGKSYESFLAIAECTVQRFESHPLTSGNQKAFHADNVVVDRRRTTGAQVALKQLRACPGRITWIEGDNGAGKSTMCGVLAGLLRTKRSVPITGEVNGEPLHRSVPTAPNGVVRLALQDPYRSFVYRTVKEELFSVCGQEQSEAKHADGVALERLVRQLEIFWGSLDRKPATFSFGQLRFLQLLLFPLSTAILILDEPLLGLASSLHAPLLSALKAIAATGRTVICTCYDRLGLATDEPAFRLSPISSEAIL